MRVPRTSPSGYGPERLQGPVVGAALAVGAVLGISIGAFLGYPGPGMTVGVLAGLLAGSGIKTLLERRNGR